MRIFSSATVLTIFLSLVATDLFGQEFMQPGRTDLRHDLLRLFDSHAVTIPVQTWPISRSDLNRTVDSIDPSSLPGDLKLALLSLRNTAAKSPGWNVSSQVFIGNDPLSIRKFSETPRADSGFLFNARHESQHFSVNIQANALINPLDEDEFNLDGTSVSTSVGNWILSAGWQERWWGPGWNSSLILSTNARPSPGIALQRKTSEAFENKWLSWVGPWTVTTFMNVLNDERDVKDALLWGARFSFVPMAGIEIGLSRTAQWCGDGRPCGLSTFSDVLLGNDNRGVNVTVEEEPGNQLAGIDVRWTLPRQMPVALYLQWIGEDSRQGGPEIGSWLRQAGVEHWGKTGDASYRLVAEWSDTTCREGGAGFSTAKPNCAYRHPVYSSGYTFEGLSIGHSAAGDSRAFSLGATLVQSRQSSWNVSIRHMQINRLGPIEPSHAISADPLDVSDLAIWHSRKTSFGRVGVGLRVEQTSPLLGDAEINIGGHLSWSSL